jgi:hypothetical protein
MSSIHQYAVKVNGIDEKLNLVLEMDANSLKVSIDYENVTFSNTNVFKESIRPDIKKINGGRSNNNDLTTILKNNNTEIDFIYDKDCETALFEVKFNISKTYGINFCESIILEGDFNEFKSAVYN